MYQVIISGIVDKVVAEYFVEFLKKADLPDSMTVEVVEVFTTNEETHIHDDHSHPLSDILHTHQKKES